MFRPPTGDQGGRTKHLRVLQIAFLFRQGGQGHDQFQNPPFGIGVSDERDELVRKVGEPYTSSLAIGLGELAWEKWRVEGLVIHVSYDRETMTPWLLTVGPECWFA